MSGLFSWPPSTSSGASGGNSAGLETTGDPVDVSGAAPPVFGQVLTATDPTHATWRVPGLHYDPAIRFNVNASGEATIEPNTWGFVETHPVAFAGPIVVFVVSSLTSPPVDCRFGLYVGRNVDLPVEVHLIGASQIMGLDGQLGTTVTLQPNAMYEWVFYHESGVAIWGLVSDTADVARRLFAPWNGEGETIDIEPAVSAPLQGQSLVFAVNGSEFAAWGHPTAKALVGGDPFTPVNILGANPIAGKILTATSDNAAGWFGPAPATTLATTPGTGVIVSAGPAPSAGQILTATDATHALWANPSFALGTTVYTQPNSVTPIFAEEFSSDPIVSGVWGVAWNSGTPTRAGDVNGWSAPAAGTYRSTLIGSTWYLQLPSGQGVTLTKNLSGLLTGGSLMLCRVLWPIFGNETTDGRPDFNANISAGTSAPDLTNRLFMSRGTGNNSFRCVKCISGTFTTVGFLETTNTFSADCMGLRSTGVNGTTTASLVVYDSVSGTTGLPVNAAAGWGGVPTWLSLEITNFAGAVTPVNQIVGLDFLRVLPPTAWIF